MVSVAKPWLICVETKFIRMILTETVNLKMSLKKTEIPLK